MVSRLLRDHCASVGQMEAHGDEMERARVRERAKMNKCLEMLQVSLEKEELLAKISVALLHNNYDLFTIADCQVPVRTGTIVVVFLKLHYSTSAACIVIYRRLGVTTVSLYIETCT